jgi:glycerophosphoryl diester phosphodiesterase
MTLRTGRAPWMDSDAPLLRVAHRGASRHEPQNTLRAFRRALEFGVEMIETDLRRSADGEMILAHDPHFVPKEGLPIHFAETPFEEIRRIDVGLRERIPTLAEALELCKGRCALMIDFKEDGLEEKLVRLLHDFDFKDAIIPGAGAESRRILRELDPTLPISLSLGADWKDRLDDALFDSIETDAVTWQYSLLDAPAIERLHRLGLRVFAWTVDSPEEMRRLVDCGVDALISNRSDLLMEL